MATAYKLSTNARFRGGKLYPKGSGVRVRRLTAAGQPDVSTAGVLRSASRPAALGTATGRQLVPTTGTAPGWMEVTDAAGKAGWVRYDLLGTKPVAAIKQGDGKALVQAYVQNEIDLAKKLAYTGELLARLKKKQGISGAKEKLQPYLTEQKRLELRQKDRQRRMLAASDIIKVTSKIDPWQVVFKPSAIRHWYGLDSVNGLGAVQVGIIIVAAVLLVGAGAALYAYFQTDAKASEADLNKHKDLAAGIAKLRELGFDDLANKLQADVNAYGKEQAEAGKQQAEEEQGTTPLGQAGSLLKWGTIGFFAFKLLA